jgi:hypothetical protein
MRFRGELDRAERDASEAVDELIEAAPRWAAWGLHELGEIRRRRGDLASIHRSEREAGVVGGLSVVEAGSAGVECASGRVGDSVVGVGAVEAVALSRSVVFGQAEAEVSA